MKARNINFLLLGWLTAFAAVAQSRFSQDVRGYDIESLFWAALMSLFGGALRTIFTLASDTAVVQSIVREVFKDAIIAIIAGIVTYIAIEAVRAAGWLPMPSALRFACIVFAGWSRMSFFGALDKFGHRVTEAAIAKAATALGGAAVPTEAPEEKPKPFQEK